MILKFQSIFASLSTISCVFSYTPPIAHYANSTIHHPSETGSRILLTASAVSSDALAQLHARGLSLRDVDSTSTSKSRSSRTVLSPSSVRTRTMMWSDADEHINADTESLRIADPFDDATRTNTLTVATSSASNTASMLSDMLSYFDEMSFSHSVSQPSTTRESWEKVFGNMPWASESEARKTSVSFTTASSSVTSTNNTSTSAGKTASSSSSSTTTSSITSTSSTPDPIEAALNYLTSTTDSTSSSSNDKSSSSTVDPTKAALDWLTSAGGSASSGGKDTSSTAATHTSSAAANRLKPGCW